MVHEIIFGRIWRTGNIVRGQDYWHTQGMLDGKQVSWLPSYGPEMRGGTA